MEVILSPSPSGAPNRRRRLAIALGLFVALAPECQAANLDWETFWTMARSSSPRVRVLKVRTEQARTPVALEVPPPMIGLGTQGVANPFDADMEQAIEVTQKLPFPSKFFTAARVKDERVRVSDLEAETALLDQKLQVFELFVDLHELLARRQLVLDKQKFYQEHLKRLKAYTISEQAQQLHILEVEATLSSLEADLRALDSDEKSLRLKLGTWLPDRPERPDQDGALEDTPSFKDIDLVHAVQPADGAESPYLKLTQSLEGLRSSEGALARSSWLPDLSLTYRRHIRRDNVMPSSNELVLGVELPFIFPGQPAAKVQEARLSEEEATFLNAQRRVDLHAQERILRSKLEATREQLKLMVNIILPSLEKRTHLLHRLAQTDMESLDLHRTTYDQLLSGKEKNLRLESDYRKTLMELETLGGDTR